MAAIATKTIRRWVTASMLLILIGSLAWWWWSAPRLPRRMAIATGELGGMYHRLGSRIAQLMRNRVGRPIEVLPTAGSGENAAYLNRGQVNLAIEQGGTAVFPSQAVITPLYLEYVFILVRRDRGVETFFDLFGRRVALGKSGSGMRESAARLLSYFDITAEQLGGVDCYFRDLLEDDSLDAAIVTTGAENPDLANLLRSNQFDLLPIPNTAALSLRDAYFTDAVIPAGLFSQQPPLPAVDVHTLATTAFLITTEDAPDALVAAALSAVHEDDLRLYAATLIARDEAARWVVKRLHPAARRYFHPGDQLGDLANTMESIAAGKELMFAFGAGVYLLWQRWRRLKERESQRQVKRQKEHLDEMLQETLKIESQMMTETNPQRLKGMLEKVTRIKMKALQEFTDEELRADSAFSILLDQCAHVIQGVRKQMTEVRVG